MTPPRTQCPGSLINFQQPLADMNNYGEDEVLQLHLLMGIFQRSSILYLDVTAQNVRNFYMSFFIQQLLAKSMISLIHQRAR